MTKSLRILVVDDSPLYRKVVCEAIAGIAGVEVIGRADNGRNAISKIEELKPDVITLDVEMPELDGLGVLDEIKRKQLDTQAIMLSSLTRTGARTTTQALIRGAFDFILKPDQGDYNGNVTELRQQLIPRINAVGRLRIAKKRTAIPAVVNDLRISRPAERSSIRPRKRVPQIIAIGISTGGPAALMAVLTQLPADFPVPIIIAQHMPSFFTRSLAEDLDRNAAIHVREAEGGDRIQPGTCLLAPGGKQTKLTRTSGGVFVRLTDDPPEGGCRPSINYLFRSVEECYGPSALAMIMTGMGEDGREGCQSLHQAGATIWTQDQESSTASGMPRQIVNSGIADRILPLAKIAEALVATTFEQELV